MLRLGLQRLAVVTTGCTLLLVALGGLVRATDNGLACPDWPRCYGAWLPRQADLPAGLTLVNVWVEHTHRLVAMLVGVLIAVLVVVALARYRDRPDILWPAVAAGVAVNVQAALGGVVVLQLLRAELVTAHLGMAMVVVASLVYLALSVSFPRASPRAWPTAPRTSPVAEARWPWERPSWRDLRFARAAAAVTGLALVQILVGGHVTGIGAGLAFGGFPLFDGTLVPVVATADEAWHVAHRLLALALALAVVVLARRAGEQARSLGVSEAPLAARRWLVRLARAAVLLVAAQVALGAANLWTGLSAWTVTPHLAVASWLWAVLVLETVLAYRLASPRGQDDRELLSRGLRVLAGGSGGSLGHANGRAR
jgi:cytochrome c oxidase assembly protein subunit 15